MLANECAAICSRICRREGTMPDMQPVCTSLKRGMAERGYGWLVAMAFGAWRGLTYVRLF
jgi:hypothetical protein